MIPHTKASLLVEYPQPGAARGNYWIIYSLWASQIIIMWTVPTLCGLSFKNNYLEKPLEAIFCLLNIQAGGNLDGVKGRVYLDKNTFNFGFNLCFLIYKYPLFFV